MVNFQEPRTDTIAELATSVNHATATRANVDATAAIRSSAITITIGIPPKPDDQPKHQQSTGQRSND